MCQHCELIDYPVAECWRPCSVPGSKARAVREIRKDSGQDYFESAETIAALRTIITQQRTTITRLAAEHATMQVTVVALPCCHALTHPAQLTRRADHSRDRIPA